MGEKSSRHCGARDVDLDLERDTERERTSSVEYEVIRLSGTWWVTVGPSLGSKVA